MLGWGVMMKSIRHAVTLAFIAAFLLTPIVVAAVEDTSTLTDSPDLAVVDVVLRVGERIVWTIVHDADETGALEVDLVVRHEWIDEAGDVLGNARSLHVSGVIMEQFTFDSRDRSFGRAAVQLQRFIATPPNGALALRVTLDVDDADVTNNMFEAAVRDTDTEEFIFAE